ncbi:hypothetical protein [Streptomyces chumphonensis]|uniref:hypothetical protein n=1 Tax=Streptomyces chumphonensis TaxID=1214925 RepID=UPI003D748115
MTGARPNGPGRRAPRALAVALALVVAVTTAVLPGREGAAAGPVAAEHPPLGVPFLPSPDPLEVSIDRLLARSLSVRTGVRIRLSDGTEVTTTQYTFKKLTIRRHMNVTQRADGHTVVIDVPEEGSLGGTDDQGNPQTTVMWGDITNICVRVLVKICGVQGLLDFFGSLIPLTAGAEDFEGRIYAIRTIDEQAGISDTDNPIHLPGTITVTAS